MVNLVIVSHSARLGEGVGELAQQMLMGGDCKIAIAAGIDDPQNPIGTDPIKVMEAIESAADADHVLVMMDIGSALLSAETALDLRPDDRGESTTVRRAVGGRDAGSNGVSAAAGADIDKVIADAMNALEAKREQLGLPSSASEPRITPSFSAQDVSVKSVSVVIKNPNGLHVRPASRLVATLSAFNADLLLEKTASASRRTALIRFRCCRFAVMTRYVCWQVESRRMMRWPRLVVWRRRISANRWKIRQLPQRRRRTSRATHSVTHQRCRRFDKRLTSVLAQSRHDCVTR